MSVPAVSGSLSAPAAEEILSRAAALPELTGYPTVDELIAEFESLRSAHPELISVQRIGTSRLGEPIPLYTVAGGDLSGLLVGGVHPNEPIGSWTLIHLLRELTSDAGLRDSLNTTWRIIPCADPDAMRLNEGWFRSPEDRETYFRNFYRPAGGEQVEWTFPFSYKNAYFDAMLPETQALQRAIDVARPDFYVPLHNAEAGGAYYYLSEPVPELYGILHRLPENLGIPLHRGEPEAAHFTVLAPAIFEMGTLEDVYDWMEGLDMDPAPLSAAGEASTSYARRYGTLSLIAELPLWSSPEADDTTETDAVYAELLRSAGSELSASGRRLTGLLERAEQHLRLDTPFLRASRSFLPAVERAGAAQQARGEQEENRRPATVSEAAGLQGILQMFRLRFGGIFLRALQAETSAGTASAELRRITGEMEALFSEWLTASEGADAGHNRELPVRDVAGLQYGAVLALAQHCLARRAG